MRWYRAKLYEPVAVGKDSIGNDIFELKEREETIMVRKAPYVPQQYSTEGNPHLIVERLFITNADPSLLVGVTAIEVGVHTYDVLPMSQEGRITTIRARRKVSDDKGHR